MFSSGMTKLVVLPPAATLDGGAAAAFAAARSSNQSENFNFGVLRMGNDFRRECSSEMSVGHLCCLTCSRQHSDPGAYGK